MTCSHKVPPRFCNRQTSVTHSRAIQLFHGHSAGIIDVWPIDWFGVRNDHDCCEGEEALFVRRFWVIFGRDWKDLCISARKATNGRTDEEGSTQGCDFISSRRNRDANSLPARALLYILSRNHARPCRMLGIPYLPSDLRHNE
jgi:hypothetical protein